MNLKVNLLEIPATITKISETILITFDSFSVKKTSLKPITPQEERMWTDAQWLSFLSVSSNQSIISIPKTELRLETESYLLDLRVEYSLNSKFASGVDVALNLGRFQFLKDLITSYIMASSEKEAQKDSELEIGSGTIIHFVPSKPFNFVRRGELNFEPLLKLVGEATPKDLLSKLGLEIDQIPKYIYNNVIYLSLLSQFVGKGFKWIVITPEEEEFHSPTT